MYSYTHRVQYYETDQMKIVHHSNYIRWFEEARCAVLASVDCGYDVIEKTGIVSPVLGVNAAYKSMTRFGETVIVECAIAFYNGVRLNLAYTVRDSVTGEIRCTGETRHCFLDEAGKILNLRKAAPEIHEKLLQLSESD